MTVYALFRRCIGVVVLLFVVSNAVAATVYRLKIPEIACSQCTARIERALLKLEGVRGVNSDVPVQTVTVEMDSGYGLVREEAESAIGAMGFSVREFEVMDSGQPRAE